MVHPLPFSPPWSMSCLSTMLEVLISVFRAPPSLSVMTRRFRSSRRELERLFPV